MFGLTRREAATPMRWTDNRPWQSFRDEMEGMFENFFGNGLATRDEPLVPRMDLAETESAVEITTDVPGFTADEIDIEVGESAVTVRGRHEEETKSEDDKTFHRVERRTGSFSRYVHLPCEVNREQVNAELKNGVLSISLQKSQESQTKKVKVKG